MSSYSRYFKAPFQLDKNKVPAEMHIYAKGRRGFDSG